MIVSGKLSKRVVVKENRLVHDVVSNQWRLAPNET